MPTQATTSLDNLVPYQSIPEKFPTPVQQKKLGMGGQATSPQWSG